MSPETAKKVANSMWVVLAAVLLGGGIVIGRVVGKQVTAGEDVLQMAMMIVVSSAMLIVLLSLMAAGFQRLGLADKNQALGLPEGSVRSLIALLLLVAFVICSIYLFRQVSAFNVQYFGTVTAEKKLSLGNAVVAEAEVTPIPAKSAEKTTAAMPIPSGSVKGAADLTPASGEPEKLYDVWVRVKTSNEAGDKFAHEVFAALLTLVTAVSAFYFGARGSEAQKPSATSAELTVVGIDPDSADPTKGKAFIRNLRGAGFVQGAQVKLASAQQSDIVGADVEVLSSERIICAFDISGKPAGKWDVIVANPDKKEAKGAGLFEIK